MKFSDRLSDAVRKSSKERQIIARDAGISRPTLNKYCDGDLEPRVKQLIGLITALGVNPRWLLTGIGEMYDVEPIETVLSVFNELKEIKLSLFSISERLDK